MKRIVASLLVVTLTTVAHAGVFDFLKKTAGDTNTNTSGPSTASLAGFSQDQVATALKDALGKGVQAAITNLGQADGFLKNPKVKIPMPEKLASVEKSLRAMKQDKYADEFVATMNHAAEAAVPEALPIFTEALKSMSIDDAKKLVTGGNDSATQFFKTKGETQIQEKMSPIIKQATEKAGVTASYKKLVAQATGNNTVGSFLGKMNYDPASLDVDKYVTQKASDGLFKMIAEEEERIRKNPQARTTELLQKVFGAVK